MALPSLAAAVEANQVLDLLCRREMPPARGELGNPRHVGERDELAGHRIGDTSLAHALHRGACHRPTTWQVSRAEATDGI